MVEMTAVPIALSMFHTLFNVINTFVMVWFVPQIKTIVVKILPQKESEEEEFHLKYITTGLLSTPELSLLQARKELQYYAKHSIKMFSFVERLMDESSDKKFNKLYAKVQKYEDVSDEVEVVIANYLSEVAQGKLSDFGRHRLRAMLKLVSDIESIGDCNYNLARTVNRMRESKIVFPDKIRAKLDLMFRFVEKALEEMKANLEKDEKQVILAKAKEIEDEINNYRTQLKSEHLENLRKGVYNYETGIVFADLFCECEKLGDYAINVSEALVEVK